MDEYQLRVELIRVNLNQSIFRRGMHFANLKEHPKLGYFHRSIWQGHLALLQVFDPLQIDRIGRKIHRLPELTELLRVCRRRFRSLRSSEFHPGARTAHLSHRTHLR